MFRNTLFVALILSLIISRQRATSSVLPRLTEEAPLLVFLSSSYTSGLGHIEFKTLLTSSCAFCERPHFSVSDHPISRTCIIGTSKFFSWDQDVLHSANLQATIQAAGFLRVPPKSSFKKLLLGTGLWQHAKNEYHPQDSRRVE